MSWKKIPAQGPGRTFRARSAERPDGESQPADFAINARVRQVLARRWVIPHGLDVGTTDGVVLMKGRVEREPGGPVGTGAEDARERFLRRLRSEIKAIPGVVEVIMEIPEVERTDTP